MVCRRAASKSAGRTVPTSRPSGPPFRELHMRAWPGSLLGRENERKFFDALVVSEDMRDHLDLSVVVSEGRIAAAHFGFV